MGFVAEDVMQKEVRTVRPDTSLVELERIFCDTHQSGFPVVGDGERLLGVVSNTDIVRKLAVEQSYAEYESTYYWDVTDHDDADVDVSLEDIAVQVGQRLENLRVDDVMSHSPITVSRDTAIQDVARMLIDRKIHRVPVVDSGSLVGIVTSTDLVRMIADGSLA